MQLQYQVEICAHCREHGAEHSKHHGEFYGAVQHHQGVAPRLPDNCGCCLKIVGDCPVCGVSAEDLGAAGSHHIQLGINLVAHDTGEKTVREFSMCANCLLTMANVIMQFAQSGQLDKIAQAIAPKILPASNIVPLGAARIDRNAVIPGGKFRRH